jgi:peptidyl-tRNA hydrolase
LVGNAHEPCRACSITRHNIGFLVLDALAQRLAPGNKRGSKAARRKTGGGFVRDVALQGEVLHAAAPGGVRRLSLVKPTTMMNLSGSCVQKVLRERALPVSALLVRPAASCSIMPT